MANLKKISVAKLNAALACIATIATVAASPLGNPALGEPLAFVVPSGRFPIFDRVLRQPAIPQRSIGSTPDGAELPAHLRRLVVDFRTTEAAGTIIVDTPNTYLYYVLGGGTAIRYGIGVGREGFTWSGVQTIARKAEWPDWIPPAKMLQRQPYLPRFMTGGPGNPLGARAMYLRGTIYRIHGTDQPSTIGGQVSSGCIRRRHRSLQPRQCRREGGGAAGGTRRRCLCAGAIGVRGVGCREPYVVSFAPLTTSQLVRCAQQLEEPAMNHKSCLCRVAPA
jgi:lipoprotein-anchoring transpeptidase ErfK/SrfK